MTTAAFRQYLYPPGHPRIAELKGLDAYAYRSVAERDEFTGGLIEGWRPLYLNPFEGVTSDGTVIGDLYALRSAEAGEEAPVEAMVAAAESLLAVLDDEQREQVAYAVDAPEWQTWANPEFLQFDTGLRLERLAPEVRERVMDVVAAATSPEGYERIVTMMRINGFLGEVVGLEPILNQWSYNFALYGEPSTTAPWGFHLYGHHCVINCLVVGSQMVMTPVFLGAEPNEIDEGPHAGTPTLTDRIARGRAIMAELTPEQRERAVTYAEMVDPAMPEGRLNAGDERHLAGAFQDNRVIPYEGVPVRELCEGARRAVLAYCETFCEVLPQGPRRARLREIEAHLDDTWFSWIGGTGPDDVFYARVQSPVIIAEVDHHCGVFLDYDTPKDFHIHTVMRTPNGNDYGRALVRQWQMQHPA